MQDAAGCLWLLGKSYSLDSWLETHVPLIPTMSQCYCLQLSKRNILQRSNLEIQSDFAQGHKKGKPGLKSKTTLAGEEEAKEG